jgi:hypothetical protein
MPAGKLRRALAAASDKHGAAHWYMAGPHPVMLVTHIDRIGDHAGNAKHRRTIYHDRKHGAYWSPDGLGADDRAGVCAALALHFGMDPAPGVLFCDHEEHGGAGAREAAQDLRAELSRAAYLVELDRRGKRDAVYYNHEPAAFRDIFTRAGYKTERGSFSDVAILGRATDTCAANLSIGYRNEHTTGEYLIEKDYTAALDRARHLLLAQKDAARWTLPPPPPAPVRADLWRGWDWQYVEDEEDAELCEHIDDCAANMQMDDGDIAGEVCPLCTGKLDENGEPILYGYEYADADTPPADYSLAQEGARHD